MPTAKRIAFLLAVSFFCCGMGQLGQVREHREELGTLKEQAEEEREKSKELDAQKKSFDAVKAALVSGELKAGARGAGIVRKFGQPNVDRQEGGGRERFYISPSDKWLEAPRVELYFDKEDKLTGWECFHAECA